MYCLNVDITLAWKPQPCNVLQWDVCDIFVIFNNPASNLLGKLLGNFGEGLGIPINSPSVWGTLRSSRAFSDRLLCVRPRAGETGDLLKFPQPQVVGVSQEIPNEPRMGNGRVFLYKAHSVARALLGKSLESINLGNPWDFINKYQAWLRMLLVRLVF